MANPQHPPRQTDADGFGNRAQAYLLSHFRWLWRLVMAVPWLRKRANKVIINNAVGRAKSRPHAISSMAIRGIGTQPMAGYTSWESLNDRAWFSRHLPPRVLPVHPDLAQMRDLFQVRPSGPRISEDSTVLFISFAQWFTDGFLMTERADRRRTLADHHIDFNPLYGLTREHAWAIRTMSEAPGQKGRLKTEIGADGEAYAPRLYDSQGQVKAEFKALRPPLDFADYAERLEQQLGTGAERLAELRGGLYAFAGERANTTPFTAALNILFLREHNRVAGMLEQAHPDWDDERIFQTARNVNVALLIKIVVDEYINHISPYWFQLSADPWVAWRAPWNKPNWIPIEFNLLYRWHSMTPDTFTVGGAQVGGAQIVFAAGLVEQAGLGAMLQEISTQRAWEVGLLNTPAFLVDVELASIGQSRQNQIGSYNDYREAVGYPRVRKLEQITGDPDKIAILRRLYNDDVENIEFTVGLLAEDVGPRSAVPPLIGRMVALDAFSQAMTNPLLAEHVWNEDTFSKTGMAVIAGTRRLQDILDRNSKGRFKIAMTYGA